MENQGGGREFALSSGAVLLVSMASFQDAKRLHNEVLRALRGTGAGELDLAALKDAFSTGKFKDGGDAVNMVVDRVMTLAASDEVQAAIFACAKTAVYKPDNAMIKVTPAMFDDVQFGERARGDFYQICMKVMEVNLSPFFKAIFSSFGAAAGRKVAAQA